MSEEDKKPAEDLDVKAEGKKDAEGQWHHCSRTTYCGVNNMVVYDGPTCTRYSYGACSTTQAI